ncbi:hypothetical protein ACFQDN_24535 [Pseudomonas asuensis]|uniref:Adhesin n=1 Tax=Pseudomonas asuensis TaxID=1825787 RepID=A0ABQ2GXR3_9PSED|nr:hypothetical protein [Pseudomonas asuensis]GGM18976.1 hypothetical protein GCM10009425_32310 [Pseudomonas asuensis]
MGNAATVLQNGTANIAGINQRIADSSLAGHAVTVNQAGTGNTATVV